MADKMTLCELCIHGDICIERELGENDEKALTYCAYYIAKYEIESMREALNYLAELENSSEEEA